MPVSLGSLDRVDRQVADALRQIAGAVNQIEERLGARGRPAATTPDAEARAGVRLVEQQVQGLGKRLRALEGPEPAPPPGVAGDPNPTPAAALPLYDGLSIVEAVFAANPAFVATSCQNDPGGTWDLMDAIVDALRAADTRFAYNGKRGNANDPSLDAVAYDFGAVPGGEGATSVYIVDVIAGHCGPNPQPAWQDVTVFAPGVWISRGRF